MGRLRRWTALIALLAAVARAQVPTWPQTWQMNRSTILMTCNYSGFTDPRSTVGWAIVDYDWSNAKGTGSADGWAKHKPMDCEEMLVKQVQMAHALSPNTGYFIYRNAIKALNWYTTVRTKLYDPAYASWFLKFNCSGSSPTSSCHVPVCDNNYSPPLCTALYHDQGQTPGYPHGDGDCAAPACDCGKNPCGEYLFDFRSLHVEVNGQSMIDWYVNEYFFSETGAGNPLVAGFYTDDSWSSSGPTEMDANSVRDMGLSAQDVADVTAGYILAQAALYPEILKRGKFVWDQTLNHDPYAPLNGDCPQPWVRKASCSADLRDLCVPMAAPQTRTLLYGFSPGSCTGTDPRQLTEVETDVVNFLLVRGPYAYLGNGWSGCGFGTAEFPPQLNLDYGDALGMCAETAPGSGVFRREFTKSTVQMDCSSYTPSITWK